MKISEIISKFEQSGKFKEDPHVIVSFQSADGSVQTEEVVGMQEGPAGPQLMIDHRCAKAEPRYVHFWNGKLLDDMSQEELKAALVSVTKLPAKAPAVPKA